jgi:hypothetical protein
MQEGLILTSKPDGYPRVPWRLGVHVNRSGGAGTGGLKHEIDQSLEECRLTKLLASRQRPDFLLRLRGHSTLNERFGCHGEIV